jgi:hypothetical protein
MPHAMTEDGVRLYYEETGSGKPLIFVHEFVGDYWSWEPQMRHFGQRYRCIAFSARGYPPSGVPENPASYSQNRAADDIRSVAGPRIPRDQAPALGPGKSRRGRQAAAPRRLELHLPLRRRTRAPLNLTREAARVWRISVFCGSPLMRRCARPSASRKSCATKALPIGANVAGRNGAIPRPATISSVVERLPANNQSIAGVTVQATKRPARRSPRTEAMVSIGDLPVGARVIMLGSVSGTSSHFHPVRLAGKFKYL